MSLRLSGCEETTRSAEGFGKRCKAVMIGPKPAFIVCRYDVETIDIAEEIGRALLVGHRLCMRATGADKL